MTDPQRRLGPQAVAERLFVVEPDRDERASQLCAEALLTLLANDYSKPDNGQVASPKLRRFALRSLVLEENFLQGYSQPLRSGDLTAEQYGHLLAAGADFQGADNLALARTALKNLVDPSTEQGRRSQHLMLPFHEALLWYDSRWSSGRFTVRKVRMRGSGITFARMLLDPPEGASGAALHSSRLVPALKEVLSIESPLSEIADLLESELPPEILERPRPEDDEQKSWELGADPRLASLASALCRHCEGVLCQGGASPAAKLWQLRTVLALDLAVNTLRRAWEVVDAPEENRRLLAAVAGPDRQQDRLRLRSERSWEEARVAVQWATVATLASIMEELAQEKGVSWASEVDGRTARLLSESVIEPLESGTTNDFVGLAQKAFENANYDRSGTGFRVLLESIGMSAGGTRFRFLSASPDLLASLVGALSAEMPMPSAEFFRRAAEEWGLVMSPEGAAGTAFAAELDGAELALNARRFERLMIEAGLASGLSDRTVLVGEQAGRRAE